MSLTFPAPTTLLCTVFEFTAPSAPSRHREIAKVFAAGGEEGIFSESSTIDRIPDDEIGAVVYDRIAEFLVKTLSLPRGLEAIGYKRDHVPALVQGTIPQRRVLDLAPGIGDVHGSDGASHLTQIIERSLSY